MSPLPPWPPLPPSPPRPSPRPPPTPPPAPFPPLPRGWPGKLTCSDVSPFFGGSCPALAALVAALPGLASPNYTQVPCDPLIPLFNSTCAPGVAVGGVPWFSTASPCGSLAGSLVLRAWTGVIDCTFSTGAQGQANMTGLIISGVAGAAAFPSFRGVLVPSPCVNGSAVCGNLLVVSSNPGLSGSVPAGAFDGTNLAALKIADNPGLCLPPLTLGASVRQTLTGNCLSPPPPSPPPSPAAKRANPSDKGLPETASAISGA